MKVPLTKNTTKSHSSKPYSIKAEEGPFFTPVAAGVVPTFGPLSIQPKLTIGEPNDQYEQEADEMANRISRMPMGGGVQTQCEACQGEESDETAIQTKPLIQRQEEEEEQASLQTKPLMLKTERGGGVATPSLVSQLNSTKGGGSAMPKDTNRFVSQAFGQDFGKVRVHTDSRAVEMNQGLNARAFTHGSDIYFNRGQYNPDSSSGRQLLAHELTHVVQQNDSNIRMNMIQRDLQRDLSSLLEIRREVVPTPSSPANRALIIRRLLTMSIPYEEPSRNRVLMERRRILWEILRIIDTPEEAEGLHNRLQIRRSGDILSEPFHDNLATLVRRDILFLLQGIYRPGQLAVDAAETFPGIGTVPSGAPAIAFGSFARSLSLNPDYWIVSYMFRLQPGQERIEPWERRGQTEIVFSTYQDIRSVPRELDHSGPQGLEQVIVARHANRVISENENVDWANRYHPPVIEISFGAPGPEAALTDLWDTPSSRSFYAMDCWVAAVLTELRGIYLTYSENAREEEFDRVYESFWISRDTRGVMYTSLASTSGLPASGPGSSPSLRELTPQNLENLGRLPEDQRPSLAQRTEYEQLLTPGDLAFIHNRFLGGEYETENVVYLGTNRFFGHPLGVFNLEEYAFALYRPWDGRWRPQPDWPTGESETPASWQSVWEASAPRRRADSRPIIPTSVPMRRPWATVEEQVIEFVGQHTEVVPRARARADVRPTIALR